MKPIILLLCAFTLYAQTNTGGLTPKGAVDASGATSTKPSKSGTSLPASCGAGETYFKTNAAAGLNWYLCTGTDTWTLATGVVPHPFGASFDGGGAAIAANAVTYMHLPYACTIQAWNIAVDTGTVTAKVWKVASGTAIPTSGDSINTSGIAISSNTNVRSTTLSDFTTVAVAAHDIAAVTLTAVSGATKAIVTVECN